MEQERELLAIEGAKGKGGKEDPDSLRSRSDAQVVAVVSEGEIEGFEQGLDPLTRIYLDDTPIKSENGRFNFAIQNLYTGSTASTNGKGSFASAFDTYKPSVIRGNSAGEINSAVADYRVGTQDQTAMPGFDDVRIEQNVGLRLTNDGGAITKTTSSSSLDRLIVRVGVANLIRATKNGDIKGSAVSFRIKIFTSTGSTIHNDRKEIKGKSRGPVDFEYEYKLSGAGPWTVEVRRITPDSTSTQINDELIFKALVGVIDESFRYPNTALIGLKIGAENFSSVPRISADLLGLKIKVPSNYNTKSRTYSGIWNGTFKTEYCNNPAWVFYDLITNNRYGCGQFISESQVDKFALYSIAQYCDELVSDGRGGREPRFTFNAYITTRGEAYEVLNGIASAFRGMLYYQAGTIVPVQDKPRTMTKIFSPANVLQAVDDNGEIQEPPFSYEGTGRKARKTVALVSWNDPDDFYKEKVEYVEDRNGLDRYGYQELQIRAFGTTSQGQAHRIGRWALLTNQLETEVVTFKVATEGFFLLPGEVIGIADPTKGGKRYGGRIAGVSSASALTLDAPFVFTGAAYSLSVALPNGEVQTRTVTSGSGTKSAVTVSPGFSIAPAVGSPWVLQEGSDGVRKFRIISASENEGTVTVAATLYEESKYELADTDNLLSSARRGSRDRRVLPVVKSSSIILGAPL
jgi:predicted phage tail protein